MSELQQHATAATATLLLRWFERAGYVRTCDPERRLHEGQAYKKGYEVRFLLASRDEVREVRRLARAVGLRPGAAYAKHQRIVQPLYGATAVDWFVSRLPVGRERVAMGFSPRGRRIVRRSRLVVRSSRRNGPAQQAVAAGGRRATAKKVRVGGVRGARS
jgi:hypothetical protein